MSIVVEKLEAPTVKRGSSEGYCPLACCAECRRPIPRPDDGQVVWRPDQGGTYLDADFLHAGCVAAGPVRRRAPPQPGVRPLIAPIV